MANLKLTLVNKSDDTCKFCGSYVVWFKSNKSKEQIMYVIYDWANNLMNFGEFNTFDEAWSYLLNKFEDDEDLGEYEVREVTDIRNCFNHSY